MTEIPDVCKKGLTEECFKEYPELAKRLFAYRLFCLLSPPFLSQRLQEYLDVPAVVLPPDWTGGVPPIYVGPWDPGPTKTGGGAPPAPEPVDIMILGSTSDGFITSRADNWQDARDGDDYISVTVGSLTFGSAISAWKEGLQWYVRRTFLFFDLSDIPAGSKINSAILGVTGIDNNDSAVRVYEGTQEDPIANTDFNAYTGYPFALADWEKYAYPDLNTNLMTLSSGGIAYVKSVVGGTAKFCLREDTKDRADVAPDSGFPYNGCAFAESGLDWGAPWLYLVYV